ncbi:MAG: RNA polymerase sigma factor [Bacteroidota bacterium]
MAFKVTQDLKNKEEQLIKACQRHERLAQSEFFRLYSGKFLGITYRFAGDFDTANDLLQEGFIKIFNCISDYRFQGSFEGWMRKIIVTTSINYIKKHMRMQFEEIDLNNFISLSENPVSIDKMNCDDIISEINKLPLGFRTVINLYAIEGYTYPEIAVMLDIKEVTVRSQYMRAKQKLAIALEKKNNPHYEEKIV